MSGPRQKPSTAADPAPGDRTLGDRAVGDRAGVDRAPGEPGVAGLSFEDALAELEQIVRGLEGGQQKLEDAIGAYERGAAPAPHCEAKLAEAEAAGAGDRRRRRRRGVAAAGRLTGPTGS